MKNIITLVPTVRSFSVLARHTFVAVVLFLLLLSTGCNSTRWEAAPATTSPSADVRLSTPAPRVINQAEAPPQTEAPSGPTETVVLTNQMDRKLLEAPTHM